MTEGNTHSERTEQQIEQRKELFRYTALDHPVIQVVFDLQIDDVQSSTAE